LERQQQKSL
jgi:hypothetical protein